MTVEPRRRRGDQLEGLSNLVIDAAIAFMVDGEQDLGLGILGRQYPRSRTMQRKQDVLEDIVGNLVAAANCVRRIEVEVYAQVDAAEGVFPGGLAEAIKRTWRQRAVGDGVEFIGADREMDMVRAIIVFHHFEQRGPDGPVAGDV